MPDGTVVLLAKAKNMLYATLKCPPPGKKSREGVIRCWQSKKKYWLFEHVSIYSSRTMPALPTIRRSVIRNASHFKLLSDAKACESSSPGPSQRVRESIQNLCVVLLILVLSPHNNTFQVKGFVDSGNNGLDGVRISFTSTITACSQ